MTVVLSVINIVTLWAIPDNAIKTLAVMPNWDTEGDVSSTVAFYETTGEEKRNAATFSSDISLSGMIEIYEYENGEWVYMDYITKNTMRSSLYISYEFDGEIGKKYKMEFRVSAYNRGALMGTVSEVKHATCS
ncbi:MAG: hypothetical protein IJA86_03890 [Clostridia bacterium]|nr:hypothetical protein [Clostridia bacterium]